MCLIQAGQYKYKLNAQYLRLFGVHSDVNDAHRAGASRLKKKKTLISENLTSLRVVFILARVKQGCVSTLVSKSGHCGLFVEELENNRSVHWLRQGDKESGEELLKRAYQQAADEGTLGLAFSASGSLGIRRPAGMAPSTFRVSGFRRGTLRSELVSFLNAAGWRDTEVVSASMRKDYMITLVRARPPCNSLLAPWCYVMPQRTVDYWVPAAKSKPLVKLADSAMRFTPKESETPSAFTVAERNVCALIRNEDSDGSGRDGPQRPGGPAMLRRCADSWVEKLWVYDGQQRWSWKLHVRSNGSGFCQSPQDSDRRSHSQDSGGGKDDDP